MTDSTSQFAVVITTSSPGFAWVCLRAAGLEPRRTAVLTTPGASIPDLEDSLGRTLAAMAGLTGVQQIVVLGHEADPAYRLGVEGLSERACRWGADPRRGGWGNDIPFPRLAKTADRTVARAVQTLARAPWLPAQFSVVGIVVSADGSADTVAIEASPDVAAQTLPESAREVILEPVPEAAVEVPVRPADPVAAGPAHLDDPAAGETAELGEIQRGGPTDGGGPLPSGPVDLGGPVSNGPADLSGPVSSGPATLCGPLAGGPVTLGGPIASGATALGEVVTGGRADLATPGGAAPRSVFDALEVAPVASLQSVPVDVGTSPASTDLFGEPVSGDDWLNKKPKKSRRASIAPEPATAPRRQRAPARGEELDERIRQSTAILARFVHEHCQHHPLRRDMKHLLRTGASPEAVMRNMFALVRDLGRDLPEVRAGFGTLEMAQSLVDRATHQALLRTIIL